MISFLLVVVGFAVAWIGLLWWRLALAPGYGRATKAVVLLALLAGFGTFFAAMATREGEPITWLNRIGLTFFAGAFYLLVLAIVLGVIGLLARLGGRDARRRVLRVGTPLVVVGAVVVTGYGTVEADRVTVNDYTLRSADLPESADGLRVALITDLHTGPVRKAAFTQRVVDLTNDADVDLVVLGGDLGDGTVEHVGDTLDPLADLDAPAYAVTGNHEYISGEPGAWVRRWESLGIKVLRNRSQRLPIGVTVAGVEDASGEEERFGSAMPPDYDAALGTTAADDFVLFAAHQPAQAADIPEALRDRVDLQVSGHTHGGQLWPFGYVVRAEQGALQGLERVSGVRVLTSRGAGAWGPPVRVLAPPEVPVFTLERAG